MDASRGRWSLAEGPRLHWMIGPPPGNSRLQGRKGPLAPWTPGRTPPICPRRKKGQIGRVLVGLGDRSVDDLVMNETVVGWLSRARPRCPEDATPRALRWVARFRRGGRTASPTPQQQAAQRWVESSLLTSCGARVRSSRFAQAFDIHSRGTCWSLRHTPMDDGACGRPNRLTMLNNSGPTRACRFTIPRWSPRGSRIAPLNSGDAVKHAGCPPWVTLYAAPRYRPAHRRGVVCLKGIYRTVEISTAKVPSPVKKQREQRDGVQIRSRVAGLPHGEQELGADRSSTARLPFVRVGLRVRACREVNRDM